MIKAKLLSNPSVYQLNVILSVLCFFCFVLFVLVLCLLPNVDCVSGLSIPDCPYGFICCVCVLFVFVLWLLPNVGRVSRLSVIGCPFDFIYRLFKQSYVYQYQNNEQLSLTSIHWMQGKPRDLHRFSPCEIECYDSRLRRQQYCTSVLFS